MCWDYQSKLSLPVHAMTHTGLREKSDPYFASVFVMPYMHCTVIRPFTLLRIWGKGRKIKKLNGTNCLGNKFGKVCCILVVLQLFLKNYMIWICKNLVKIFKVSQNNPCQLCHSTYVCNTEMWTKIIYKILWIMSCETANYCLPGKLDTTR